MAVNHVEQEDALGGVWVRWIVSAALAAAVGLLWAYVQTLDSTAMRHINALEANHDSLRTTVSINSGRLSVLENEVTQLYATIGEMRVDMREHRRATERLTNK